MTSFVATHTFIPPPQHEVTPSHQTFCPPYNQARQFIHQANSGLTLLQTHNQSLCFKNRTFSELSSRWGLTGFVRSSCELCQRCQHVGGHIVALRLAQHRITTRLAITGFGLAYWRLRTRTTIRDFNTVQSEPLPSSLYFEAWRHGLAYIGPSCWLLAANTTSCQLYLPRTRPACC